MRTLKIILFVLISVYLNGQEGSVIRIQPAELNDSLSCFHVQLNYHGEEAQLASQNFRFFYDSEVLHFSEEQSSLLLSDNLYGYNVVQHLSDLDASGVGELSFENNLGFINAAIILNDARQGGTPLSSDVEWLSILDLCFENSGKSDESSIILARKDLTSAYGRAFIEMSRLSPSGTISSLHINKYLDYKL